MTRPITRPQFAKALLKARREELKQLQNYNGALIHDCGRRIDGIVHQEVLQERIDKINQELEIIENNIKEKSE